MARVAREGLEYITVEEALALLEPDAETVHVYTLDRIGADWPRQAVEEYIRAASELVLLTKGPHARMGHHGGWLVDGQAMSFWTVQNPLEVLAAFRASREVSDG